MNFEWFKRSMPAKHVFRALGLEDHLDEAVSWSHLRRLIVAFNDCDEGHFVNRARRYDGYCSSGERVLLHAILHICDFSDLADEFDEGRTWHRMTNASGEFRQAVAACVAAEV